MSLREYYSEAISRAFWASFSWALDQGLALSFLLAIGLFVVATIFAASRALSVRPGGVRVV